MLDHAPCSGAFNVASCIPCAGFTLWTMLSLFIALIVRFTLLTRDGA